jgi:hypothetical protein
MSLWIVKNKDASMLIIGCNFFFDETTKMNQLWVTKADNKSMLIFESKNKEEVHEMKEAIDYAIEHNEPVLRLA